MSALLNKLRKAREQIVEVGGFKFTIRRPTDLEMIELGAHGSSARLLPFVVGWEGVKELDIIPGGDPTPAPFDADVCADWLSDRPDLWGEIASEIVGSYRKHCKDLEALAKN